MADEHPLPTNHRFQDLSGKTFAHLSVLAYTGLNRRHRALWLCRCDCGNEKVVIGERLRNGRTKSCGCWHRDNFKAHGSSRKGSAHNSEWSTWSSIRKRCLNPKHRSYKDYGGRGITICDRWRDGFENFLADMGPKPSPRHSIDRIDNALGYYCGKCQECLSLHRVGNCRWATWSEQHTNRRDNHRLAHDGLNLTISEWSVRTGIRETTICARLKYGWTISRTLTTPVRHCLRRKNSQPTMV